MEDYNFSTEEDTEKKSKYNSAVSQLYRIDSLWQKCHYYRTVGRLIEWNNHLDCIWTELASDSKEKDDDQFDKFMSQIIKSSKNRNELYQTLMKKEIWLRRLQNNQGKGTAYNDTSEDDFD